MTIVSNDAQRRGEAIGDEIRISFEKMGQEIAKDIAKEVAVILIKDSADIRGLLKDAIRAQSGRVLSQSKRDLQKAIDDKFGGSVFGDMLNDFAQAQARTARESLRSTDFKAAAGQRLVDFGKAIVRARRRNG